MYDIKQFKPALYVLLMLGLSGYALAAQTPGLWVLAAAGILLNAWLVWNDSFRPIPRWVANLLSTGAFLLGISQWAAHVVSPILVIGQFLVLLHLVKVWEQRTNRDHAQLLVLSLLLMVAAAISTASLLFGIMLIVYLFLSLYCCLLFHLKVETDEAKRALAVSEDRLVPATLRQDQRFLGRSMRRFTAMVAGFAVVGAVLVFIFFPRGAGAGMLGQLQWKPRNTLTGFSEQVSFQQVARITQDNSLVATVRMWRNGKQLAGTEAILLRGVAHEIYSGPGSADPDHPRGAWEWYHAPVVQVDRFDLAADESHELSQAPERIRAEIDLSPTGTAALFAPAGPVSVRLNQVLGQRRIGLQFLPADQTLSSTDAFSAPIRYTVTASGEGGRGLGRFDPIRQALRELSGMPAPRDTQRSVIDPKIRDYALQAEVSGAGLAERRGRGLSGRPVAVDPLDEQIARNIEHHLQSRFSYTLDLTDARRIQGQDPMVSFLYDLKRGHCEYFAGAMTLMCQSLGMTARMVVGFKCDEYNSFGGGAYVVRQSHAHAWVEVLTGQGWKTFDPTSGHEADPRHESAMLKLQHFMQFLERAWATSVIAYDNDNRDNLIQGMETSITNSAINSSQTMGRLKSLMDKLGDVVASNVIGPLLTLLVVAPFAAVGWFLWERWRLRRKARRIGLDTLPVATQQRLVRQLGFYDDLLRLLERHDIRRPVHMTPMEFGRSLAFLPAEAFDTVLRLTQLFYRIRYGGAELQVAQQRRVAVQLQRLTDQLPTRG